jgi:DNA-binding NtrC family response regulator
VSGVRLLLVEDDTTLRRVMTRELTAVGFEVEALPAAEGAAEALARLQASVALVDLRLPGRSGLELLRELREVEPNLQAVMLTGHGGVPEAVEAMRLGAYDFLTKPTPLDVLEQVLRRAAEKAALLGENQRLRRVVSGKDDPFEILGQSAPVVALRELVARLAPSDAAVLIQGENGSGKELVARNLHRLSPRGEQAFVVLNCGALPSQLVESELFGHERGAFTGADRKRMGLFEAADRGTLLLDEIAELPLPVQPALLRVLQFGEVRPVGHTRSRTVDVRVLAATNRDLAEEVRAGRFREDLYYRLSALVVRVPPLRERRDDLTELARTFLARAAARVDRPLRLTAEAERRLAEHLWPGNVRELENAMLRLSLLAAGEEISAEEVERLALGASLAPAPGELPTLRLDELEKQALAAALARHGGDKRAAAAALGISLRTLYYKLEERRSDDGGS